jgi:hypothetical protein
MSRRWHSLVGLLLWTEAQPDRWVHVGGIAGFQDDYADRESVKRNGDEATLWIRRDFKRAHGTAWHEIKFDCRAGTAILLAWISDDGAVTHNVGPPQNEPLPIGTGSVEEAAFKIACH